MNQRRIIPWWLGVMLFPALVSLAGCRRGESSRLLPGLRDYPDLPAAFAAELRQRRDQVVASNQNPDAIRHLASLYHANHLHGEAGVCYDLLARQTRELTARDHYLRADVARNRHDLERALAELRAVVALEPDYVPARLALAEALFKTGEENAAAEQYAAVVAQEPTHPQASVGLARIELQRGDEAGAAKRLQDLLVAHPDTTSAAALLAPVLRRRGEVERAARFTEISQQRPERNPADPWMDELLADAYDVAMLGLLAEDALRTGDAEKAQSLLDRIEKLDPASPIPALVRGQAEALARRYESAVGHLREALAKGGDPERICPSVTQALINVGRTAEAVAVAAEYHGKRPASLPIAKAYADALVRHGDDVAARPVLEQVVRAEPHLRAPNMDLARILWTAGERETAVECLRRVAAAHADDIPSRALLGEYYLDKSDPKSALPPLQQALALATPGTPAHSRLAGLLAAANLQIGAAAATQGRWSEAADRFEEATTIAPSEPNGYAALANVRVQQRQYARAAETLRRLALLQPGNATVFLSLGDVLHRQGEHGAARVEWEQALSFVGSGNAELRAAIEARLRGEFTEDILR